MTHDNVTILQPKTGQATKVLINIDGHWQVQPSKMAKFFRHRLAPVSNMLELVELLEAQVHKPNEFLIRGHPTPEVAATLDRFVRRLAYPDKDGHPPTFYEFPRRWLLLDYDKVETPHHPLNGTENALYLRDRLPEPFHNAACWWCHTSSAGIKPGVNMRLAFWLSRPLKSGECSDYLSHGLLDGVLFQTCQPHYIAAPINRSGLPDPVVTRSGLCMADSPQVELPPTLTTPTGSPVSHTRLREYDLKHHIDRIALATPSRAFDTILQALHHTPEAGDNPFGGYGRHDALLNASFLAARVLADDHLENTLTLRFVVLGLASTAYELGLTNSWDVGRHIYRGFRTAGFDDLTVQIITTILSSGIPPSCPLPPTPQAHHN